MSTRRRFLGATIGSVLLGGCLELWEPDARDLRVENTSSSRLTVTVTAQQISESTDFSSVAPEDGSRPEREPVSEQRRELPLDAGEDTLIDEFIDESGVYFVEATIEEGSTATEWMEFGGGWISITVEGRDQLLLTNVFED